MKSEELQQLMEELEAMKLLERHDSRPYWVREAAEL